MKAPRVLAIVWCTMLASCVADLKPPPGWRTGEQVRAPVAERQRTYYDAAATHVKTETQVLILGPSKFEKHGRSLEFFEDGTIAAQREYRHDEPTGTWTTWYESGAKRSQCAFTDPPVEAEMLWWYENGAVETRGQAINSVRVGTWTSFFESGAKMSEGRYVAGRRDGVWTTWCEDGSLATEVEYHEGVRVPKSTAHHPTVTDS
jgi:hypothetical protein